MSIVNRQALSELFGVNPKTISSWSGEGMPYESKGENGKGNEYNTKICIAWHLDREVGKIVGEGGRYKLESERARLTHHQANKTALEEQILNGDMIYSVDALEQWSAKVMAMRSKVLALPSRLATKAIGLTSVREIESFAREEIFAALEELSHGGDPESNNESS